MTDSVMDNLVVGGFPVVTESVTIKSGEGELVRGTLIAMLTSGEGAGSCVAFTDAANTPLGEGVFYGVLLNNVDASTAAATATVALSGKFNTASLLVHDAANVTVTVAVAKPAMRALNCYQIDPNPIGVGM